MNTMHLLGAEQVERAASSMNAAADKMQQAARDMDYVLGNHQRFMNDWLERLQNVLEEIMPQEGTVFDVNVVPREEEDTQPHTIPAPPPGAVWVQAPGPEPA
jgi:hypothetical protein